MSGIISQAEALRPGRTCSAPDLHTDSDRVIAHGTNLNILLTFDDDVKWFARIRQNVYYPYPTAALQMHALSEAASYRAMKDMGVDVPGTWVPVKDDKSEWRPTLTADRALTIDPDLAYFFVEHIPGQSGKYGYRRNPAPDATDIEQIHQYAKWTIDLEKVTFDAIGSPAFDDSGAVITGPTIDFFTFNPSPPFFLGPFKSMRDRYIHDFDARMQLILDGRWCEPRGEIQAYLQMLEAKTLVEGCAELAGGEGPFYIRNGETKCDNILHNEDGTVSGVIDWDWCVQVTIPTYARAYTTSKAAAYASPQGLTSTEYFSQGSNEPSVWEVILIEAYERLGRTDLADFVRNGKKYLRLERVTHPLMADIEEMIGLRGAFGAEGEDEVRPKTMVQWVAMARERYRGDEGLEGLMAGVGDKLPEGCLTASGEWV